MRVIHGVYTQPGVRARPRAAVLFKDFRFHCSDRAQTRSWARPCSILFFSSLLMDREVAGRHSNAQNMRQRSFPPPPGWQYYIVPIELNFAVRMGSGDPR